MASKKPAVQSTAQFDDRMAAQLERRSRSIGAPVDAAAIDRVLATVGLAGTTAIITGVEAAKLDPATAAKIKRARWGGEMRSMLSFLKTMVRRRDLGTPQIRKKVESLAQALSKAKTALKTEPAYEAAITLAEIAIDRLQEDLEASRGWKNARLVEYLASTYWTFKQPKKTRARIDRESGSIVESETVRFIQAALKELGTISYARDSIISIMQGADKPRRKR